MNNDLKIKFCANINWYRVEFLTSTCNRQFLDQNRRRKYGAMKTGRQENEPTTLKLEINQSRADNSVIG